MNVWEKKIVVTPRKLLHCLSTTLISFFSFFTTLLLGKGQELLLTSISTPRIAAWPGSNSLWSRRKTACGVEGAFGNQQCGLRYAGLVQCHVDGVHVEWLTTLHRCWWAKACLALAVCTLDSVADQLRSMSRVKIVENWAVSTCMQEFFRIFMQHPSKLQGFDLQFASHQIIQSSNHPIIKYLSYSIATLLIRMILCQLRTCQLGPPATGWRATLICNGF